MRRNSKMVTTDDIMRQLNRKKKRTEDVKEISNKSKREVATEQPTQKPQQVDSEPVNETPHQREVVEPIRTESVRIDNPRPTPPTKPIERVQKSSHRESRSVEQSRTPSAQPDTSPSAEIIDSKTVSSDEHELTPETPNVPKHPEIERHKPVENFKELSVFDKLMFKDIFVNEGGEVIYNTNHTKTVAKNLSKGVMDQIVDDLRRKHVGAVVGIGSNNFTIRETNSVYTSPTSLIRYLMLDKIEDENIALQLARQLFLEKHPGGEKADFDHSVVRTDERDIYAILLSSKADPERDLVEKVEELIRSMDYLEENATLSNRKLLEQTSMSNDVLNGMNIAVSLLVLERLGLTEGALPRNLDDIRGFATQDSIVKMSDIVSNDIAADVMERKRTLARDERRRQSTERMSRRGQPRTIRRGPTPNQDYNR